MPGEAVDPFLLNLYSEAMERIVDISVVERMPVSEIGVPSPIDQDATEMEGYAITTDRRVIYVLIDGDPQCCERFGYCHSEDDVSEYTGSLLLSMSVTDDKLDTYDLDVRMKPVDDVYLSLCAKFVTFHTDRGVFQIAVYNYQNGYYGHDVLITSGSDLLFHDKL